MTRYEVTFIARDEQDPGVAALITAAGGTITSERSMGRRMFAYPIKKETAGYYTTYRFEIEPAELAELTRQLELHPGVLRTLVVSVPEVEPVATDLEIEGLKEAKELGEATGVEPKPEPPASKAEREAKLQEQLDKLLGGDDNTVQD